MESWLPWFCDNDHVLPDLLPAGALALLAEPRRMRDRAQELLDEEANLASVLGKTWGLDETTLTESPKLSLPFDRLLERTRAGWVPLLGTPDDPSTPSLAATPFDPVRGDTDALVTRLRRLRDDGMRVFVCAEGTGGASRIAEVLGNEGLTVDVHPSVRPNSPLLAQPGVHVVVAPLDRGVVLPAQHAAVIAEADLTGRRRVHRAERGARKGQDFYEGLTAGDFVVHRQHGIGRYDAMVERTMFGFTRDYLVSRIPRQRTRLRAHRSDRHHPQVHGW